MRTLCEHCLRVFDSDQRSIAAGGAGTHDFLDDPEHPTAPVKKPVDSSVAGGTDTGLTEREQIIEEFAEMPQAVPQSEWKRLGIGYGPLSGQVFPEACAFELSEIGPQGEPVYEPREPRFNENHDENGQFTSGVTAVAEQGGHAGGGVSSEEELARPGKHYIVDKHGRVSYHGKSFAPEETPLGGAHVTVKPNGDFQVNAGTLTESMKSSLAKAVLRA